MHRYILSLLTTTYRLQRLYVLWLAALQLALID
jgi:hypothetical protein